ncbi:MAG TPA: hypothetical protein VFS76_21215 [Pyrinomonadaceae bacterium]|nr:hypothetical protein [Pyrinomonadaceae bacterium]
MSAQPSRLLKALRSVLPNAAWDAIKNAVQFAYQNWALVLVIIGFIGSGLTALINRLRGIPSDAVGILVVFGIVVVVALLGYVVGRIRDRKRSAIPDESDGSTSNTKSAQDLPKPDLEPSSANGCKDEWLHEKLKTDKATIWDLVWVASIFYRTEFDKSQPYIDFVFKVFNMSLIDVVISMDGGYILFSDDNERFFFDPKPGGPNPARCYSRDSINFVIRQAVTADQINNHFKSTDNTRISFGNLSVNFRGTEQFPEITSTHLDVNHYLFTADGVWENPNRPKFLSDQECKLPHVQAVPPKLSFEIDWKQSQVNTLGGGTAGRRISANIRLRCVKIAEYPMAIREFHASLHKEGVSEPIVPQEGALVVMGHPDMKTIDFADGWTVNEPLTGYRWLMFYLDITEQQLQKLSRAYYMRVTMVAVGQQPISIDFDIDSWQDARKSNSYITERDAKD